MQIILILLNDNYILSLRQHIDKHYQSEKSVIESENEREFIYMESLIKLACQILGNTSRTTSKS